MPDSLDLRDEQNTHLRDLADWTYQEAFNSVSRRAREERAALARIGCLVRPVREIVCKGDWLTFGMLPNGDRAMGMTSGKLEPPDDSENFI